MSDVKRAVADECGVSVLDLESSRRDRTVAHARQLAMVLGKQLTPLSLPQIGAMLGKRDHSTVHHGIAAVERRRRSDPAVDLRLRRLRRALEPTVEFASESQPAFFLGPLFDFAPSPIAAHG